MVLLVLPQIPVTLQAERILHGKQIMTVCAIMFTFHRVTFIQFKFTFIGWGYTKDYANSYERIFGAKDSDSQSKKVMQKV